jgi:putative sigma-54 modulation protein
MKTALHARHFVLDARLRSRIERKLQRLERVADPEALAMVELTAKASHAADAAHVVEITLVANGATLRSTSAAATPMAALDAVVDKLERQVIKAKERMRRGSRSPGR